MPDIINETCFETFFNDLLPDEKARKFVQVTMGAALINGVRPMALNFGSSFVEPSQNTRGFLSKLIK